MGIHLHLPRLASCLFWPIAKSGFNGGGLSAASAGSIDIERRIPVRARVNRKMWGKKRMVIGG